MLFPSLKIGRATQCIGLLGHCMSGGLTLFYQFCIPLCDLLDPIDGRADLLDRYMVLGKAMTAGQGLSLYVLLSTNLCAT